MTDWKSWHSVARAGLSAIRSLVCPDAAEVQALRDAVRDRDEEYARIRKELIALRDRLP